MKLSRQQISTKIWGAIYFTHNISHAYLWNVETSNLVLLKTYNNEFDEIIITFTDPSGSQLEIEDKFNLTLLINK